MDRLFKCIAVLIEAISFVKIVLSPLVLGAIMGLLVLVSFQNTVGIIVAALLTSVGFVVGIVWAVRVTKTTGATSFLARRYATPDIDDAIRKAAARKERNNGEEVLPPSSEKKRNTDIDSILKQHRGSNRFES